MAHFQVGCHHRYRVNLVISMRAVSIIMFADQLKENIESRNFPINFTVLGLSLAHQTMAKAYVPLRRKQVALGPGVGLVPQRHYFALGIPTCWYLKMLKFAFPPTQNPNASQWNIGCVGSLALGPCIGHVHFIFFV